MKKLLVSLIIVSLLSLTFISASRNLNCQKVDTNKDGIIGIYDLKILINNFRRTDCGGNNKWCNGADFNKDGKVNLDDLYMLHSCWR